MSLSIDEIMASADVGTERPRAFAATIALMQREAQSALEEFLDGTPLDAIRWSAEGPRGIPVALGNVIIAALGSCETYGIDIATALRAQIIYNRTRSYRHGGKLA